jgi:hypothetical protein
MKAVSVQQVQQEAGGLLGEREGGRQGGEAAPAQQVEQSAGQGDSAGSCVQC